MDYESYKNHQDLRRVLNALSGSAGVVDPDLITQQKESDSTPLTVPYKQKAADALVAANVRMIA